MIEEGRNHRLFAEFRRVLFHSSGERSGAIERALHDLAARLDAFPHQKLNGVDAFKLRVGNHRVIYESDRDDARIHALAVGNRRDIYERFL